jgi:mRNA interferase MazF
MIEWMKTKLWLHTRADSAKNRVVKRGQVYRCNLGCGVGSEMEKERPCVVLQNDIGNLKSPNTIVAPITHDSSKLPCIVPIAAKCDAGGNVVLDGQVNTSNVLCVSKARLGVYIADLTPKEIKDVDRSLAQTLGIIHYYASVEAKLADKLKYAEDIKRDRNIAEDALRDLFSLLDAEGFEDAKNKIENLKKSIDK